MRISLRVGQGFLQVLWLLGGHPTGAYFGLAILAVAAGREVEEFSYRTFKLFSPLPDVQTFAGC